MSGDAIELPNVFVRSNTIDMSADDAQDILLGRNILLRNIYNAIDTNKDGNVDRKELASALQSKCHQKQIPIHVIQVLFEHGDTNKDGVISFEEFCELINRPDTRTFFKKFFHIPQLPAIKGKAKSYWESCKWMPPPIINLLIIIVQIAIFMFDYDKKCQDSLEFVPNKKGEVWRYYTYSLIHQDWPHLVGNSIFQLCFGSTLEPVHGYRVACIFVVGVLGGSLASAVFEYTTLVGASGGVYALIFSWLSDIFLNWSEQQCPMVSLIPVIVFVIWEISIISYRTSYAAHFAGGITGFAFGIIILKNIKERKFEQIVRNFVIWFSIVYFLVFVALNIAGIHV